MYTFSEEFKENLSRKSLKNIRFFEEGHFSKINYDIFLKDLSTYVCNHSINHVDDLKKSLIDIILIYKESDKFFNRYGYIIELNILMLDLLTMSKHCIDSIKNNYSLIEEFRRSPSTERSSLLNDYHSEIYKYLNNKDHNSNYAL